MSNSPGHVFVVHANILNLACSAWLLPTDQELALTDSWRSASGNPDGAPSLAQALEGLRDQAFGRGEVVAALVPGWPPNLPQPIATAVPFEGISSPSDVRTPVRGFFGAAKAALETATDTQHARGRHLLALPFFATEGGGGDTHRGQVLDVLLEVLTEEARSTGFDVALVLRDPAAYDLAQAKRRAMGVVGELNEHPALIEHVHRLASTAVDGRLVPFLGAGASVSAGGPTWDDLLNQLAQEAGITDSDQLKALGSLGSLDAAAFVEQSFLDAAGQSGSETGGSRFREALRDCVGLPRYGLAPSLLASFAGDAAITLNYDRLFEMASADQERTRTVIPAAPGAPHGPEWLLKLHGTIENPGSMVLTRDDYLGFRSQQQALSGLVQAHLLTHHMLFVGFGLTDDHFHEIVHEVRKARPADSTPPRKLGTALVLGENKLQRKLWERDLEIIAFPAPKTLDGDGYDIAAAGRLLEIFLDAVACHATTRQSYLMKENYRAALSVADRHLRRALYDLASALPDQEANGEATDAVRVVRRSMDSLGWAGHTTDPDV